MSISTGTTNASIQKTIACSYLADLEPDLFETVPRPGGILNIELPPPTVEPCCNLDDDEFFEDEEEGDNITIASSRRSTLTSMTGGGSKKSVSRTPLELAFERTTRPVRIDKVMNTCPWSYADANQTSEISIDVPGSFQDSIDLLAISISTIMLMAANYKDIPSRHFDWTSSYLECIKDDYGHHPPNIKGILNQIKLDYDNVMADRVAAEIAKAADGDAATQVEVETSDRPTETEPQESEALKPSSSITSKSSTKGSKSKILSQTKVRGSKTSTTEPPIPEDG